MADRYDIYLLNFPLVQWYSDTCHLAVVNTTWMECKELFLNKYLDQMKKDREYLYKFYKVMGKGWIKLREKKKAFKYIMKALKVNPFDVNTCSKLLKLIR